MPDLTVVPCSPWGSATRNVDTVLIAGKVMKLNGQLVGVAATGSPLMLPKTVLR
jgi:hypothetical protein